MVYKYLSACKRLNITLTCLSNGDGLKWFL